MAIIVRKQVNRWLQALVIFPAVCLSMLANLAAHTPTGADAGAAWTTDWWPETTAVNTVGNTAGNTGFSLTFLSPSLSPVTVATTPEDYGAWPATGDFWGIPAPAQVYPSANDTWPGTDTWSGTGSTDGASRKGSNLYF